MNEKTKKILIGVAIAIVVIAIAAVAIKMIFFNNNKVVDKVNLTMFDPKNAVCIEKDGKYGYISSDGKMLIEPQYDSGSDFYGDYAVVKKKDGKESKYIIIDKKGSEKFSTDNAFEIEYHQEANIWTIDEKLYDENLKQLTPDDITVDYIEKGYLSYEDEKNKVAGIMDSTGKSIYKYKFDTDSFYFYADIDADNDINDEVYAKVKVNYTPDNATEEIEKEAIISCKNGKVIYDFTEESIFTEDDNIFEIIHIDEKDGDSKYTTVSVMYIEGNQIAYRVDADADLEFYDTEDKILEIDYNNEDKKEYYNLTTKQTYTNSSDIPSSNSEEVIEGIDYRIYRESSDYGIILNDKIIIKAEYDDIEFLPINLYLYLQEKENKQIVLLEKGSSVIVRDLKKNKDLFTFNTNYVSTHYDSSFIYAKDKTTEDKVVYNCISGKSMNFSKDSDIDVNSNYIIVKQNNTKTYYNTDFKEIYKVEG